MNEWRKVLRENFTSLEKLCAFLEIDVSERQKLIKNPSFSLNVPRRLADKCAKKTIEDPIFKQFVPQEEELKERAHFLKDPVGDKAAQIAPKCLHKYERRVLLLPTSACAMHCRFCFRKHFSYEKEEKGLQLEFDLIRKDPSIKEVILSGGDPLSLSDTALNHILQEIALIPHVKRIRFHSRFLIGIPERIDASFLSVLEKCPLQIWFVIHTNHPKELDDDVTCAIKKVQKLGIPVLNQAVLLKGVNDSVDVLQSLFETLADIGVIPYYLHQLDLVQGASHFEVAEEKALFLMEELKKRISGYALPRHVREIANEPSKTLLF